MEILTLLRRDLLIINEAFPRHARSIEAQIALDVLEWPCGLLIAPDLGFHSFAGLVVGERIVGCSAFPLAKTCFVGDHGKLESRCHC